MTPAAHAPHPLVTTERVKGTVVLSADGEKLGKIEEIAIDKASGAVAYAILGEGGLFGMGEHYRPIPWSDLRYDAERRAFCVPHSKAEVETMQTLATDELSGWTGGRGAIFI